jgi:two-component system, NarL family, invasion response regulator UvrY
VTRVLVVDDHPVVRHGIRRILTEKFDRPVHVGEAGDAREAVAVVERQPWDVVVLDIAMPGGGGLEALREIRHLRPRTPVLVLSVQPEDPYAVRVLKAGASGFLSKESAPEELVGALRRVLAGRRYVSPSTAERLAHALHEGNADRPLHESLTDREFHVLRLLVSGMTVTEAARELGRSVKTVSTHRTRLLRKLRLKSTVEAARYALAAGLFE